MKKNKEVKVLFILKKRNTYGETKVSYGLYNSCKFICDYLSSIGVKCEIRETIDGNTIDKEVFETSPTHVFLEAIWVTPEKIRELISIPRYKDIKWFVRIHSNAPFLSHEGMAFTWIKEYLSISKEYENFNLSCNSLLLKGDLEHSFGIRVIYSPNIYINRYSKIKSLKKDKEHLDIACFGAVRHFKNHIQQALAAIAFANLIGAKLKFHINCSRFENQGEPILKNLRAIFNGEKHKLIEHEWMNHEDFIKVVKSMDIGMQCSFTETYNIVASDFCSNDIPLVGSAEIDWLSSLYQVHPTSLEDIVSKLETAYFGRFINLHYLNKIGLENYNKKSLKIWKSLIL